MLAHFLIGLSFILLNCKNSLYILDTNPLSDKGFLNIFSHSIGCSFHFFDGVPFSSLFVCFLTWTIFKVFIEFVTILFLFYVLVFWLRRMWDLSSPTRDQTRAPCIGRRSLNRWTASEVLMVCPLKQKSF